MIMAAVACGDDDGGTGGPVSLADLPAALAPAFCTEMVDCLGPAAQQLFGNEGCEVAFAAQLEDGNFGAIERAVEDGTIRYDAAQARACLAAIKGLGCSFEARRLRSLPGCEGLFSGDQSVGDSCQLDEECPDNAFCDTASACPGTCVTHKRAGQPCESNDHCSDGLTCNGVCETPATEGQACGGGAEECQVGLLCVGDNATESGVCRGQDMVFVGSAGDTCDLDTLTLCDSSLSCVVTATMPEPTFECQRKVGSGQTCTFGYPAPCPDGEYCDADVQMGEFEGHCVVLPDVGDPCAQTFGCALGLHCSSDNTCRGRSRLGDDCLDDQDCSSEYCASGHCARRAACTQ